MHIANCSNASGGWLNNKKGRQIRRKRTNGRTAGQMWLASCGRETPFPAARTLTLLSFLSKLAVPDRTTLCGVVWCASNRFMARKTHLTRCTTRAQEGTPLDIPRFQVCLKRFSKCCSIGRCAVLLNRLLLLFILFQYISTLSGKSTYPSSYVVHCAWACSVRSDS